MNRIWANRLEAGTYTWNDVPSGRKDGVKLVLQGDVASGKITAEQYQAIVGEPLPTSGE